MLAPRSNTKSRKKAGTGPTPVDVLIFMQDMMNKEEKARLSCQDKIKRMKAPEPMSPKLLKFFNRIRHALEIYIDENGGTPHMVLDRYWVRRDHNYTGNLTQDQILMVMKDISCPASREEINLLIQYYQDPVKPTPGVMSSRNFIFDICRDIRHYLKFPTSRSSRELLTPNSNPDVYHVSPRGPLVKTFVKKFKRHLLKSVTKNSGTEEALLKETFHRFTEDTGGILDMKRFKGAMISLGMKFTKEEADAIYKHFAEKGCNGIRAELFIKDVLNDVNHWSTLPDTGRLNEIRGAVDIPPPLKEGVRNPIDSYRSDTYQFTTRAFKKPTNAVVERFKQRLKHSMDKRINKTGDLMYWILLRTFVFYDSATSSTRGRLAINEFKGVCSKLNTPVTDDEANEILKHYDTTNTNRITYSELIKDVCKLDRSMFSYKEGLLLPITDFTARVTQPPIIKQCHAAILQACDKWCAKLNALGTGATPKDGLHGICLKFDPNTEGKMPIDTVERMLKELQCTLDYNQLRRLKHWYSCAGEKYFDYPHLIKDVFPSQATVRTPKDSGQIHKPHPCNMPRNYDIITGIGLDKNDSKKSKGGMSLTEKQKILKGEKKKLETQLKTILHKEKALLKRAVTKK